MIWRALVCWFVIIVIETVLGTMRVLLLAPTAGPQIAGAAGFVMALIMIYAVSWLAIGWIGPPNYRSCLAIGLLWAMLTFGFEIALGRLQGFGWDRIFQDYEPGRGAPMATGLLLMALAPAITWGLRCRWTNASQ